MIIMTKVLEFGNDVTVTYIVGGEFDKEYTQYIEEVESYKREKEIEDQLWDYFHTLSPDDEEYSDVYKDLFGVRPRRY